MEQSRRASMAGTLYAVGGALWFGIATLVAARFGGDPPPASGAFYLSEAVWVVVQLLLLVGFFGLLWSNGIGQGIFGRLALGVGVLGHALFVVAEVHSLLSGATSDLLAMAALVSALGLLLVGIAVIRARRWQGWARFTPLLAGLYFFLVMLPFVIVADAPNLFAVGGWGLLRLALGLAIRMQGQAVNTRLPSSLPLQQG
jgi:hypothetical protein